MRSYFAVVTRFPCHRDLDVYVSVSVDVAVAVDDSVGVRVVLAPCVVVSWLHANEA